MKSEKKAKQVLLMCVKESASDIVKEIGKEAGFTLTSEVGDCDLQWSDKPVTL